MNIHNEVRMMRLFEMSISQCQWREVGSRVWSFDSKQNTLVVKAMVGWFVEGLGGRNGEN